MDHLENLNKIEKLEIYQYNFKTQDKSKICRGPMAQDWHELFPSNKDKLSIGTMDLDGITLSGLKGLIEKVNRQEEEIKELKKLIEENK